MRGSGGKRTPGRLDYVESNRVRGIEYLYYRRDGKRLPLAAPEGSAAFLADYSAAQSLFEDPESPWSAHTVGALITAYLGSANYLSLKPGTRSDYRRYLDDIRDRVGHVLAVDITPKWVEQLRAKHVDRPHKFNGLRSRMKEAFTHYQMQYPDRMPLNAWGLVKRLAVPRSTQNRRWPDAVLTAVLREATPEFRGLLITLLLTNQRIGDVSAFAPGQYDRATKTLGYDDVFDQEKVERRMVLHVPEIVAEIFASMAGRHPNRLLVTPRGKGWTVGNAEETLLSIRNRLELPRYTVHGLRKTGLSALKMQHFENRWLRALSGHTSDRNLEIYLDGLDTLQMAKAGQIELERLYGPLIEEAKVSANQRRYSGVTGKAAKNAGVIGESRRRKPGAAVGLAVANAVPNAKS